MSEKIIAVTIIDDVDHPVILKLRRLNEAKYKPTPFTSAQTYQSLRQNCEFHALCTNAFDHLF